MSAMCLQTVFRNGVPSVRQNNYTIKHRHQQDPVLAGYGASVDVAVMSQL